MPQPPDLRRALAAGVEFTELRRSQAHRLANDLVAQGQLARDQIGAAVDELIEISRHRSEELRTVVRTEVQRQLGVLGLATKRDLDALERRLRGAKAGPAEASKKTAAKAPAKKSPARKPPAEKPVAEKPAAKKSAANKAPAKKRAAEKTAANKRAPVRNAAAAKKSATRPAGRQAPSKRAR